MTLTFCFVGDSEEGLIWVEIGEDGFMRYHEIRFRGRRKDMRNLMVLVSSVDVSRVSSCWKLAKVNWVSGKYLDLD